jgi:hypothetical protein
MDLNLNMMGIIDATMDIRMDVMIDRKRDGRIKARMHGG